MHFTKSYPTLLTHSFEYHFLQKTTQHTHTHTILTGVNLTVLHRDGIYGKIWSSNIKVIVKLAEQNRQRVTN